MQKMANKVSNKKDRINEKIKNLKSKCECCRQEKQAGKFIITDSFPVWDEKIKFTVCENCWKTFEKFNEMINKKYEEKKKEADQA